ncbi:3-hydroxyacyl-CoA dehydrogenase NAD-binding domain-containing protein, partial [Pontibacter harenae]|uniref:3-hydroxyacyl-CoA dehydrogenase NAD-binding domain-containing protein n=1 Tax=Pontibacter harenae TaxID=2894083 RepID=UPI001E48F57D
MRIAVVGTGYVGLVTGTCFAEVGIDVTCIDVDTKKIENLKNGILPIYEPGLEEMVERNSQKERLSFSTDLASMNNYIVVVTKSTVPVGTANKVRMAIEAELEARGVDIPFEVASNPEFLKEGAAIDDFLKPDRIVVGVASERAEDVMKKLYKPFLMNGHP